jgi:hypothetical protein
VRCTQITEIIQPTLCGPCVSVHQREIHLRVSVPEQHLLINRCQHPTWQLATREARQRTLFSWNSVDSRKKQHDAIAQCGAGRVGQTCFLWPRPEQHKSCNATQKQSNTAHPLTLRSSPQPYLNNDFVSVWSCDDELRGDLGDPSSGSLVDPIGVDSVAGPAAAADALA